MRISDWSSDVCSSDLIWSVDDQLWFCADQHQMHDTILQGQRDRFTLAAIGRHCGVPHRTRGAPRLHELGKCVAGRGGRCRCRTPVRSEEHTSELQSLMRISYAVFCLKKQTKRQHAHYT